MIESSNKNLEFTHRHRYLYYTQSSVPARRALITRLNSYPMEVTPELLGSFRCSGLYLSRVGNPCAFLQAEEVLEEGVVLDPNDDDAPVCFLFEGRLQGIDFTLDGREVGLFFVEPGDFCGEMPLFDELARPEYVIALASSLVVKVPTRAIKAIMTENANMMNLLGKKLAVRVKQLTHQRSLLAISNIQQRVCSQLWMLCAVKPQIR